MSDTILLAHLSDVHLGPVPAIGMRHLNLKRGLGYLNWQRHRRHAHTPDALARIVADLRAHRPDHIAVTGDLVNLGLPAEYEAAARWLRELGTPDDVTVVPGNHDIYSTLRGDAGVARWAAYMRGEEGGEAGRFPFLRRVGPLALIGVNSAVETPPFVAAGEVGAGQLAALDHLLARLESEGLVRVLLIHHPPLPGQAPRRRALRDAEALSRVLARRGAELVLHGHNHVDSHTDLARLPADGGGCVPVIGVASGSMARRHKQEPPGRYNLLRIARVGEEVRIECETRGLDDSGAVVHIDRKLLAAAR